MTRDPAHTQGLREAIEDVLRSTWIARDSGGTNLFQLNAWQATELARRIAHRLARHPEPHETNERVHNHPPYRPNCNERNVNGQLRGACLNDDGTDRPEPRTPYDPASTCGICGRDESFCRRNPNSGHTLHHHPRRHQAMHADRRPTMRSDARKRQAEQCADHQGTCPTPIDLMRYQLRTAEAAIQAVADYADAETERANQAEAENAQLRATNAKLHDQYRTAEDETIAYEERAIQAEAESARVAAALNDKVTKSLPLAALDKFNPPPNCPHYAHVNPDWLRALVAEAVAVRAALEDQP